MWLVANWQCSARAGFCSAWIRGSHQSQTAGPYGTGASGQGVGCCPGYCMRSKTSKHCPALSKWALKAVHKEAERFGSDAGVMSLSGTAAQRAYKGLLNWCNASDVVTGLLYRPICSVPVRMRALKIVRSCWMGDGVSGCIGVPEGLDTQSQFTIYTRCVRQRFRSQFRRREFARSDVVVPISPDRLKISEYATCQSLYCILTRCIVERKSVEVHSWFRCLGVRVQRGGKRAGFWTCDDFHLHHVDAQVARL